MDTKIQVWNKCDYIKILHLYRILLSLQNTHFYEKICICNESYLLKDKAAYQKYIIITSQEDLN